jgi:hypothetical protein
VKQSRGWGFQPQQINLLRLEAPATFRTHEADRLMKLWTSVRRSLGGSDARYWRNPGLLQLRLRGDAVQRGAFAALIGIGVGGFFLAIMLAVAPPDQIAKAVLLGLAMMAVSAALAFLYKDAVNVTIALEDDGIRRRTKPLFVNPFGTRNRNEFWPYDSIKGCGIAPCDQVGPKYSAFVMMIPGGTVTMLIPVEVPAQQVAQFLAERGVRLQSLAQLPPDALPGKSVGSRGFKIGAALASAGLLFIVLGAFARTMIHQQRARVDMAQVRAALDNAPIGKPVRTLTGIDGGVRLAKISPDGRWVWAWTSRNKKHLLWSDRRDTTAGELTAPAREEMLVAFTPDSQRIVIAGQQEAQLWQLEPLELVSTIRLEQRPDALLSTADGKRLVAVTMTSIQLYDTVTSTLGASYPITLGAILEAGLSADGQRVIIVQQPRILSVVLASGAVEELVAFKKPNPVYFKGSLSGGANWAAMQGSSGTDVFDLRTGQQRPSLATGPSYVLPAITSDGSRIVVPSSKSLAIWDATTGEPVAQFPLVSGCQVALADNGRRFIGYANAYPKIIVGEIP